jgi:hypothetical protein
MRESVYERPVKGSRKPQWQSAGTALEVSLLVWESEFSGGGLSSYSVPMESPDSVSFCPRAAPDRKVYATKVAESHDERIAKKESTSRSSLNNRRSDDY